MINKKEVINLFWEAIEKKEYTWEELNKGKTISFVYNGKTYKVQTRLGNFWSMGISEYVKMIEKRAINAVKEEE